MRQILYKKKHSVRHRSKMISISEQNEDSECRTRVRKSFVYIVTRVDEIAKSIADPEIFIKKSFDSKLLSERFSFRVRGAFFMTQDRYLFKVEFCHTLKINIIWFNKSFSPKKSVTLT